MVGPRTILVPLQHPRSAASPLAAACLLAARFGSHIEGFALRSPVAELLALEPMALAMLPDEQASDDVAPALRQMFESAMRERLLPLAGAAETDPSWNWLADALARDLILGEYSRVSDITIIGRPGPDSTSPRLGTLESVLFESGRPVLVAPPAPPVRLGDDIVIAWNGSTETARAVAFALPILRQAARVTVLAVAGGMVPGPNAEQVAAFLGRHEIAAEARNVRADGQSTGQAILAQAHALGCDLLIKGAYTQSRLRQMIFGGATSHILSAAEIPVFLAH